MRHHRKAHARTSREQPKRGGFPVLLAVVIAVAILGGVIGFAVMRSRATPAGVITTTTDELLAAWKVGKPHPADKTASGLFNVIAWSHIETRSDAKCGQVLMSVDSTTQGGAPIRSTWVVGWKLDRYKGWQAIHLAELERAPSWAEWSAR